MDQGSAYRISHRVIWKGWLFVFLACSLLYGATAQRGVAWQDSGEYQYRIQKGQVHSDDCLARAHPLYIQITHGLYRICPSAFPFSANLLNALSLAAVVANLFVLGGMLTGNKLASFLIATTFALAHTPWWLATITETYPLFLLFFSLELIALAQWIKTRNPQWLIFLAVTNGLAWSVHNFALLGLPVYGLAALWMLRQRTLPIKYALLAMLAWVIGCSPLLTLAWQTYSQSNMTLGELARDLLVGSYAGNAANLSLMSKYTLANAFFSSLNFASLLLPLAILGWWKGFRTLLDKPLAWSLGGLTAIHAVFFLRYNVPDQFMFILPLLLLTAIGAGLGLTWIIQKRPRAKRVLLIATAALALLQPLVYVGAYYASRSYANKRNSAAVRDEARYWTMPWKHNETSAEDWCKRVIEYIETGTPTNDFQIYLTGTTYYPLKLFVEQTCPELSKCVPISMGTPTNDSFVEAAYAKGRLALIVGQTIAIPKGWTRNPLGPGLKLDRLIPPSHTSGDILKPCGTDGRVTSRPATAKSAKPALLVSKATAVKFKADAAPLTGTYLLHLPPQYKASKDPFPLTVFLHGSGERGGNIRRIENLGLPHYLRTPAGSGLPMIVLSPHCPAGKWWTDPAVATSIMAMLDRVCKTHRVDPNRIYITGLSMGGEGAWFLAQHYPTRWAAAAIVCGFGGNMYLSPRIKTLPCWIFHGEADKNVSPQNSKTMYQVLRQQGAPVRLSLIPKASHTIWGKVYSSHTFYEWLLQQKLPHPKPAAKPAAPATVKK